VAYCNVGQDEPARQAEEKVRPEAARRVEACGLQLRLELHSVAVAVQRGGALSYLHGYEQALRKLRVTEGVVAAKNAADGKRDGELLGDENGEDAASAA